MGKRSALGKRWEGYESSLAVMGESRNSYSKTDPEDSFVCAQGRRLPLRWEKTELYRGQHVTTA